jgi:hypothetical protein
MNDIAVAYEDMPCTIKAFTRHNSDDSYTIVLNERLTYEQHLISYQHELQHILNGDYDKDISADAIEAEAHGL